MVLITAFSAWPDSVVSEDKPSQLVESVGIDIRTLEVESRELVIEVVESEYEKRLKIEAEEAEKVRLAQLARQRVIAPTRADLTVNSFPGGWCTSWVASKFPVTWRGNAAQWGANAAAQGYRVDKTPVAGAAMVTWENSYNCPGCGHTVYIESVANGLIYVSEMNYAGRYKVTYRTIPVNSPIIRAVIHRR